MAILKNVYFRLKARFDYLPWKLYNQKGYYDISFMT